MAVLVEVSTVAQQLEEDIGELAQAATVVYKGKVEDLTHAKPRQVEMIA
jgi:hypothetical protein